MSRMRSRHSPLIVRCRTLLFVAPILINISLLLVVHISQLDTFATALWRSRIPGNEKRVKPNPTAFLQRYGYIASNKEAGNIITPKAVSEALSNYQKLSGLNVTGEADELTVKHMQMPRCGNKENLKTMTKKLKGNGANPSRRKRHVLVGSKWDSSVLTYRIWNYPSFFDGNTAEIDTQIKKALQIWSKVAQIDFVEKKEGTTNIDFKFAKGDHGDGIPFDSDSGNMAHGFYPEYRKGVHFNDYEQWSMGSAEKGFDVFQVAVHEIGHALGIDHSFDQQAVMKPVYEYRADFKLHSDDLAAIQELYGTRGVDLSESEPPNLCHDPAFDAITKTEDGNTYLFKGDFYWLLMDDGIAKGSARRIHEDWPGLPGSLDTAVTLADGQTHFLKGSECWIFRNKQMEPEYPRPISSVFPGIPNDLDAAFVNSYDKQLYFFKGDGYWKFPGSKSTEYPRLIKGVWLGVPNNLSDVFTQNNTSFFFKGGEYYRFNDETEMVDTTMDPPFPRPTPYWWFGCDPLKTVPTSAR